MKILTSLLIGFLLTANTVVTAVEYTRVLPNKSKISFITKQMGVPVDGNFSKFNTALSFDPAQPQKAQATITIDIGSIDAGSKEAYDEAMGPDWLDVKRFPTAQFMVSTIRPLGNDKYEARGKLTLRGKTGEVIAPLTMRRQSDGSAEFSGGFTLKRLAYGVGQGAWGDTSSVADEIQVKFDLFASPIK